MYIRDKKSSLTNMKNSYISNPCAEGYIEALKNFLLIFRWISSLNFTYLTSHPPFPTSTGTFRKVFSFIIGALGLTRLLKPRTFAKLLWTKNIRTERTPNWEIRTQRGSLQQFSHFASCLNRLNLQINSAGYKIRNFK